MVMSPGFAWNSQAGPVQNRCLARIGGQRDVVADRPGVLDGHSLVVRPGSHKDGLARSRHAHGALDGLKRLGDRSLIEVVAAWGNVIFRRHADRCLGIG